MRKPDNILFWSAIRGFDEDFSASIMNWFPLIKEKGCESKIVFLRGQVAWLRFRMRVYNETTPEKQAELEPVIADDVLIIKKLWEEINSALGKTYLCGVYDYWVQNVF